MSYQEAGWGNGASLARLSFQRGTPGREGERHGFPWEVGGRWGGGFARGWRALRMPGAASLQALLAPSFKRLFRVQREIYNQGRRLLAVIP